MDDPYPSAYLLAQIAEISPAYLLINGVIFILLLICSALVSGSEVAFFSLTNDDLDDLYNQDTPKSKTVLELLKRPKVLLSTILILNNMVNIAIVTLTTFVVWTIFGLNATGIIVILVQTVGITFAIVFFW